MTFPPDDLVQVAEDLRKLSIDATYAILYGLHGAIEGLELGDDFFPLWELSLTQNQEAWERFDFAEIKSRRDATWSVEPPKHAHGAAG